jgi:hypothetical protein
MCNKKNSIDIICSKSSEKKLMNILSKHNITEFKIYDRKFLVFHINIPQKNYAVIIKELLEFQDDFLNS